MFIAVTWADFEAANLATVERGHRLQILDARADLKGAGFVIVEAHPDLARQLVEAEPDSPISWYCVTGIARLADHE